jgi:hypothetical protein
MGTQSSTVLTADWLHGKSHYLVLAHCFAKVEDVVFINKEGAGFIRWRQRQAADWVSGEKIFLFHSHLQGIFELLEAATAFASNDGIESTSYEDAAICAKQSHPAPYRESILVGLVYIVLADGSYMFLELLGNIDFHDIPGALNLHVKAHFRTDSPELSSC